MVYLESQPHTGDVPQQIAPLLKALASAPDAAAYYVDLVRPLQEHDRLHGGDLMGTLAQYLYHSGNVTHAARALYLHRSTLLHRLGRIASLASLDLSDPHTRLALWISVLLTRDTISNE